MYQGYFNPLKTRRDNRIELMNECWIAAATYNIMLFTDWVPDPEVRYIYGWSFIVIMCCQVLSNLAFIAYFLGRIFKLYWIKYWRIYKPIFDAWWARWMSKLKAWWERFKWWLFD
jgi:hypothetical protein